MKQKKRGAKKMHFALSEKRKAFCQDNKNKMNIRIITRHVKLELDYSGMTPAGVICL